MEVTHGISKRFITAKALSVSFPRVVAKQCCFITVFCLYFFNLSFKPTSPRKTSIRYEGMDKTVRKLF